MTRRPQSPDLDLDLIEEVRAARPVPPTDPDWDELTRSIHRACAEPVAPARRGWLSAAFRPRFALPAIAAAAAVAALLWWRGRDRTATKPTPPVAADAVPYLDPDRLLPYDVDSELAPLADRQLDQLLSDLTPDRVAPDDASDRYLVPAGAIAEWIGSGGGDDALDPTDFDLLPPSNTDRLLDQLSDDQLDQLAAWLDQSHAG